jgi:hypothetical protein
VAPAEGTEFDMNHVTLFKCRNCFCIQCQKIKCDKHLPKVSSLPSSEHKHLVTNSF